jgi:hypothetical protein
MKGHYRLKGSYKMGPEVPAVEISGDEEIVDFFDGLVMGVRVKGDPVEGLGLPAFEGYAAFSWDAAKSCYKTVFANNMGELGSSEGRWAGDDLVVTGSRMQMGQPVLSRTLVKVDGDGRVQSAEAHALVGVTEPLKTFEASYTLQPD